MESLIIQGDNRVPHVSFEAESGILKIQGRSIPISGGEIDFFSPIIQWLKNYAAEPAPKTQMVVDIEFFSTAASKMLFILFKSLEKLGHDGNEVEIVWYYDDTDEDSRESGVDFMELVDVPFRILNKNEVN